MKNLILYIFCASLLLLFSCGKDKNNYYLDNIFFPCVSEGTDIDLETIAGFPEACTSSIIDEPFDENENNWYEDNSNDRSYEIKDGVYRFESKSNTNYYVTKDFTELEIVEDFQIEASIKFIAGEANATHSITWGGNGGLDFMWRFGISPSGFYSIKRRMNNEPFEDVISDTANAGIKSNGFNQLVIRVYNGKHYFFINGSHIITLENLTLFGSEIGFNVGYFSTIEIDNLKIKAFREE